MPSVELFKLKRRIQKLKSFRGYGTGLISVLIKPGTNLPDTQRILTREENSASNIKDASNRKGVITSIQSIRGLLRQYRSVPENGLVVYSGVGAAENDQREQKILLAIEPPKPITTNNYICDTQFEVGPLEGMLNDSRPYAYVVVDGSGFLIAQLRGTERKILSRTSVQLPRKHNKGGQSAQRFGRMQQQARQHYKNNVVETMNRVLIDNSTNKPIVDRIIVAGAAELKFDISDNATLDFRLKDIFLPPITIEYGGNRGLENAIERSQGVVGDQELQEERRILQNFQEQLQLSPDKLAFGLMRIVRGLKDCMFEELIVNEDLNYPISKFSEILEIEDEGITLLDWILEKEGEHGARIRVVSDATPEGSQFVAGFDGIVGILRQGEIGDFDDQEPVNELADGDGDEFI